LSQTLDSGGGFDQGSPPGSPSAATAAHYRRSNSREESAAAAAGKNVFSRLIAGTNIGERQGSNKGVINPYQGRISGKSPLICSNVAEGHNRPVLSVFATEDLLFSASKDQTVKVNGSGLYLTVYLCLLAVHILGSFTRSSVSFPNVVEASVASPDPDPHGFSSN
jgi:hypothetical protein